MFVANDGRCADAGGEQGRGRPGPGDRAAAAGWRARGRRRPAAWWRRLECGTVRRSACGQPRTWPFSFSPGQPPGRPRRHERRAADGGVRAPGRHQAAEHRPVRLFLAEFDPGQHRHVSRVPAGAAAVHLVVRNWTLSQLLISAVAGCFARRRWPARGSRRAALNLAHHARRGLPHGRVRRVPVPGARYPAWHAATRGRSVAGRRPGRAVRAGARGRGFLVLALAVMALAAGAAGRAGPGPGAWDLRDPVWDHPAWQRLANAVKCCFALSAGGLRAYLKMGTGHRERRARLTRSAGACTRSPRSRH